MPATLTVADIEQQGDAVALTILLPLAGFKQANGKRQKKDDCLKELRRLLKGLK